MVAARLTDLRAADSTQVPFKKFRKSGISSLVQCVRFAANWIWPASRCADEREARRWRGLTPSPAPSRDSPPHTPSPAPSSSDDGGFLPRLRGPLRPAAAPPLFRASSPALVPHWPSWPPWPPWAAAWTPWSPLHVSDLSSVLFPSSGEGSFPTPPSPFRPRVFRRRLPHEPLTLRAPPAALARPRARPPPRHPRLTPHEASPESRSSSSGFGSKNASSSQHNRSSRTGSLAEWRPPPYRPPPAPPPPRPASGEALDAGSVDVHYEWDRATRTPTPSTPERPRARPSRDDVEARVRAMKEEFLEFRKRQALRRRSPEPLAPLAPLPALVTAESSPFRGYSRSAVAASRPPRPTHESISGRGRVGGARPWRHHLNALGMSGEHPRHRSYQHYTIIIIVININTICTGARTATGGSNRTHVHGDWQEPHVCIVSLKAAPLFGVKRFSSGETGQRLHFSVTRTANVSTRSFIMRNVLLIVREPIARSATLSSYRREAICRKNLPLVVLKEVGRPRRNLVVFCKDFCL
ncbi:hypothetical protein EVAR_34414_1 [Eumeta japonica]|uniref:Uncharacterized protein n=1 Tax=Eumeta variegata TaxID=151549 RepID=A0A4C1WVW9_EUMVA|nr:hypothetical protein EVAR_34414_1 [Eumeta japonica]